MSMHQKHLCFFLILLLQLFKKFTISRASDPYSRPTRFFEFDSAPSPDRTPFTPSPAPSPPLQPPSTDPHSPPQSIPSPAPETPPLPLPPSQSSRFSASSGGMKGGQKAGIVVGSLAGVALLVAAGAGVMYKKRRSEAKRMQLEMAAMQPVFRVAGDGNASSYSRLDEKAL